MTEIISFYSVAPSQGKRTISLALAELLAANGHSTLYVELDALHPAIAQANQITNSYRNTYEYIQNTVNNNDFNIEKYIITHEILIDTNNRDLKRLFQEMPKKLDYLVFPSDFKEHTFPTIVRTDDKDAEQNARDYIQKMLYAFKTTNYKYVILNLPNELQSIFSFEVIEGSDFVLNVTTASPNRLQENKEIVHYLSLNMPDLESKWTTVLNMVSPNVELKLLKDLVGNDPFVIPFDNERQQVELSLRTGSPIIDENVEQLALQLNLDIEPTPVKGKFGLFKKG